MTEIVTWISLTSNQIIFLMQFEIDKHSQRFQRLQIVLALQARVIFCSLSGLGKYLNSSLPVGQVTLKFCLAGALLRLPKISNSLIIHEPKNGSQTTGCCNKPISVDCSPLSADRFHVYFLVPVLHTGYLRYYTALSQYVQFVKIVFDSLNVHLHLV